MVKINAEEYEILKNLDEKWKWIAKDDNYGGFIFCFREKPHKDIRKGGWSPDTTQYKCLWEYDSLFQFIQWEDEEPHNIAELIEEYEHKEFYDYVGWKYAERGETEVKGIEWLKREIHKELESWHGVEGGIDGDGINEIMLLINQHEESEVKRLDKKIKELDSYNDELVRDNNQFRNELDNQEVLSQEWIDEHRESTFDLDLDEDFETVFIKVEDLQNLLVPKQEKVKIESVWAEDIEDAKASGMTLFKAMDWMAIDSDEKEKQDLFARAWLDGYTVEEEQLYRARLKVITDEFIASYLRTQSSDAEDRLKALEIGSKYINEDYRHLSEFTEDELKILDIWDSEQWEVEELEE